MLEIACAGHTLRKDKGTLLSKSRGILFKMTESERRWMDLRNRMAQDTNGEDYYKGKIPDTPEAMKRFLLSPDQKFQRSRSFYLPTRSSSGRPRRTSGSRSTCSPCCPGRP